MPERMGHPVLRVLISGVSAQSRRHDSNLDPRGIVRTSLVSTSSSKLSGSTSHSKSNTTAAMTGGLL